MKYPTASFIVIGNEVLSGRTREGNLQTLAQKLSTLGIEVAETRIVLDLEPNIIECIRELSSKYSYVFTSGGIGPTHDDITAAAVAKAFNTELYEDPAAREMLLSHYGQENLTNERLKMAQVPRGSRLIENPVSKAPGFWIKNVLVMAGVPKIFEALVDSALPFLEGGIPVASGTLVVQIGESLIAGIMSDVEANFSQMTVGSYPYFRAGQHGTSIVTRSRNEKDVEAAMEALTQRLESVGYGVENQGIQLPK